MPKKIGLWIDHKRAVMVILENDVEEIRLIHSDIEKQVQFRGGAHMKTTYTAQYGPAEDHKDRQFIEKLNRFYGTIINALRDADAVFIFGPGEAKCELEKRITREKGIVRSVMIETADKMTDRQIAAKARRFFQEQKHVA